MIEMEVYQYTFSTDEEGRNTIFSNYFKCREVCEYAAKGASSYGSDGSVFKTKILIDESLTPKEYEQNEPKRERLRILNKLTKEEKIFLGLV